MAIGDLLEEILYHHIFCRLPIKSILRLRSVCKAWNCMLRERQFVKLHMKIHQQQQASNNKKTLLIRTQVSSFSDYYHVGTELSSYYFIDCDEEAVESKLAASPLEIPGVMVSERTQLLGSCNGLVAIIVENYDVMTSDTLVLWNPSTGQSKYLPDTRPIIDYRNLFGFVYDSILDDYKIIRILTSMFKECHVDIYSLRNDSWKKVKGEPYTCNLSVVNTQAGGVELNGYIYWMVRYPCGSAPSITGFCLGDESLTSLNCPLEMSSLSYYNGSSAVLKTMERRCLAAFCVYKNHKLLVWTLKDPEKKENSWEKLITLSRSSPELITCLIRPLCFTKDGKVLLITGFNRVGKNSQHQHNFGVCDPRKKTLEFVQIYGIKNTCDVILTTGMEYIPSLVSPNMFESGIRQGIDTNMHQVIDTKMHQDISAKKRKRV